MKRNLTGLKYLLAALFTLQSLLGLQGVSAGDKSGPIDIELFADARFFTASGEPSWFKDWLGKGRYGGKLDGSANSGFRLAELSLLAKADISWDVDAFAHVKYDPEQNGLVDVVEAYVRYQPAPSSALRYKFKAGLFFPHISRENIAAAWTSPFTITPSAINSWVGEEIRALGLEGTATYRMEESTLSFTAAIFGFNDPAGTLLAYRGWGLGDAKVGAFGQLPLPPLPSIGLDSDFLKQPLWVGPVQEIDNRPGFYGALDWKYADILKLGVFYYDNRGDPTVIGGDGQYAWHTKFWNFYAEGEIPGGIQLISQYMRGSTVMGGFAANGLRYVDVDYSAGFILATKTFGRYRATVRADWFGTDDNSFVIVDNNNETGSSFTAAFSAKIGKKDSLITEYLRIDSDRPSRETIGFAATQHNDIFQVSYRKRF